MKNLNYMGAISIEFELFTLTGLRVGGSRENFEIGGLDIPVIKTTATVPRYYGDEDMPAGTPYIPGSSLKGKMRSLLEWATGRVEENIKRAGKDVKEAGEPCKCGKCNICKVFGTGNAKTLQEMSEEEPENLPGPPRLIVDELYLTKESYNRLVEDTGGTLTEVKTENQINRITSAANPRKVERVPAGAVFSGRMVFHVYSEEDLGEPLELVFCGMRLVEDSYLGGYGSRGSGRVKFQNIKLSFRHRDFYLGKASARELGTYGSTGELLENRENIRKNIGL